MAPTNVKCISYFYWIFTDSVGNVDQMIAHFPMLTYFTVASNSIANHDNDESCAINSASVTNVFVVICRVALTNIGSRKGCSRIVLNRYK